MSHDTAKQFIELLEHDTSLQTQFSIASPNTVESIVDFADSKGYVFTKDDLTHALRELPESRIAQDLLTRMR